MMTERKKLIRKLKKDLTGSMVEAAQYAGVDVSTVWRCLNEKTNNPKLVDKLVDFRIEQVRKNSKDIQKKLNKLYSL